MIISELILNERIQFLSDKFENLEEQFMTMNDKSMLDYDKLKTENQNLGNKIKSLILNSAKDKEKFVLLIKNLTTFNSNLNSKPK